ncbi:Cytochrome b2 [Yarrowia sp. B02]|nr:Cytochrome b2 [Yarrowia sp. B02]
MVSVEEVAKHNSKDSCWVILHGKAYDLTEFLPEHPGGQAIILKYAGRDATKAFDPIHPKDVVDKFLGQDKHLGEVTGEIAAEAEEEKTPEEKARLERFANRPPLSQMFNSFDFEYVARHTMAPNGWAYYSSGSDDEITVRENHRAFHKIWFRPRVLVDVKTVDISTTMLGTKSSAPFYITATALGKLGHEEGEVVLTRSADKTGVIQMIPTLASCSFDEIVDAATDKQTQWMQLYVNMDREVTRKIVQHAEKRGVKGLFITVDAPQLGRREKDMRTKFGDKGAQVQQSDDSVDRSQGAARAISSFIDPALSWKDIPWFKSITKMPIVLKGVQCSEDALKAVEYKVDGIVLSNHGGRQLEFARPSIEVLVEVMSALRAKGWQDYIEVYIDGGIRRATDVIKALCLGAKGVGIGRPFLYAMSTYGEEGVCRLIQLLKDEMEMNMRLIGANKIEDLNPSMVDLKSIFSHSADTARDVLGETVYQQMEMPLFKGSKL